MFAPTQDSYQVFWQTGSTTFVLSVGFVHAFSQCCSSVQLREKLSRGTRVDTSVAGRRVLQLVTTVLDNDWRHHTVLQKARQYRDLGRICNHAVNVNLTLDNLRNALNAEMLIN